MNHRSLIVIGAVAAALSLALAVGAQAATRTAFFGAAGGGKVRPREVVLSADGTLEVQRTLAAARRSPAASATSTPSRGRRG